MTPARQLKKFIVGRIGGLAVYPISIFTLRQNAGKVMFYFYVTSFLIPTVCGAVLVRLVVRRFKKFLEG